MLRVGSMQPTITADGNAEAAPPPLPQPAVDVVRVAASIFRGVARTGDSCSRQLIRVMPLQWTCFAGLPEVFALLPSVLAAHFGPQAEPGTFMVACKRRNAQEFDKDAVMQRIVELVGGRHTVSLTNPRRVVVVEVIQALCGISVVEDHEYTTFAQFNLRQFQEGIRRKQEEEPGAAGDGSYGEQRGKERSSSSSASTSTSTSTIAV